MNSNDTTQYMFSLNITGNIIPNAWFRTITKDNGKPYTEAMMVLADIVYWYRPEEVRDPKTGQTIGIKTKLEGQFLRTSYQAMENKFGFTKSALQRIMRRLDALGVVTRHFAQIQRGDWIESNVMFLELHPHVLYELTYPSSCVEPMDFVENSEEESEIVENSTSEASENRRYLGVCKNGATPLQKMKGGGYKNEDTPLQICTPNIVEISKEISLATASPPSLEETSEQNQIQATQQAVEQKPDIGKQAHSFEDFVELGLATTDAAHMTQTLDAYDQARMTYHLTDDEMFSLYQLYLTSPCLWPNQDRSMRIRWPKAFLELDNGLLATMRYAKQLKAHKRRQAANLLSVPEQARQAKLYRTTDGDWIACLPNESLLPIAGSADNETQARKNLTRQMEVQHGYA